MVLDALYLLVATLTAPVWLIRMIRTGKIRTDWAGRLGRCRIEPPRRPRVLFHAVSVGEVNALRGLVDALVAEEGEGVEPVVATTTDTGFARACALFGDRLHVVRYPFDFSFAVRRFLRAVQPSVVILVELEVWPNFLAACAARDIPVGVVNGRLSARSFRRYRRITPLVRPTFRRLAWAAAQEEAYADRFAALGLPHERISVTGTMKWDTACIADEVDGAVALAEAMGIDRARPLVVAGSTAPDEHALLHRAVPPGAQLLCAPRKPEWFERAAADLPGAVRRTSGERRSGDRFLLDTIGELRQAYALADVVVIGRSFGELHGSDMMEPVALGKATVVGPAVEDFRATMDALLEGDAIVQTTRDELENDVVRLIGDEARRAELAENGRRVIRAHQGATDRNLGLIHRTLRAIRDRGREPATRTPDEPS